MPERGYIPKLMGKAKRTRREALTTEAINPKTGRRMAVVYSHEKLQSIARRSQGQIKEAAHSVPMVLQEPKAIFRGLLRETDEPDAQKEHGWLCYCGIPPTAYRKNGEPCEPWPGEVFLVFVSDQGVVYNWYWVKCDPEDSNLPEEHRVRFKERLI